MRALVQFFALALALALSSTALAEEASHRKAAEQLMKAMKMKQVTQDTLEQMLQAQVQSSPVVAPYEDIMKGFFRKYMGWKALKDDYVELYMKNFTEDELEDMIAFYKSKTGRKMAAKMPELIHAGTEIGMRRVQKHMPELMKKIQQAKAKQSK